MNQYEAMFLFDPTFGSSVDDCQAEIGRLMERAKGEILLSRMWDERRLAYRIRGRKRGVYVLTYFKAPPDMITQLERDAHLSENILRLLVLRADGLTLEDMEAAFTKKRDDTERTDGRSERDDESENRDDGDRAEALATAGAGRRRGRGRRQAASDAPSDEPGGED